MSVAVTAPTRLSLFPLALAGLLAAAPGGWTTGSVLAAPSATMACGKNISAVAREICGSPELLAMDREIAALFDRGLAQAQGQDRRRLQTTQEVFLRRRKGCEWAAHHSAHPGVAIEECVHTTLEERIRSLRVVADRGHY